MILTVRKLKFVIILRIWDIYYNFEWFHFYNVVVYFILSTPVNLPWWWSQEQSAHIGN